MLHTMPTPEAYGIDKACFQLFLPVQQPTGSQVGCARHKRVVAPYHVARRSARIC